MDKNTIDKTIEDLKNLKKDKASIVRKHMEKAMEQLDELAEEGCRVYINGQSENMREHCMSARSEIKIKEV